MPKRTINQITDKNAILLAMTEYKEMGEDNFLKKYGYKKSNKYLLIDDDNNEYDSKAIVGVAYKYQYKDSKYLKSSEFSGGESTVLKLLNKLGFQTKCFEGNSDYLSNIIYNVIYTHGTELHLEDIKNYIIQNDLYHFGAEEKNIKAVISNTINRHCNNNTRTDQSDTTIFLKTKPNTFTLYDEFTYAVIAENDESQWDDIEGEKYHFPNKYKNILKPGTRVIYYKGVLKDKKFKNLRFSDKAYYFGHAIIGEITEDKKSTKSDLYAEILNYEKFETPILAKNGNDFLEEIPNSKKSNYWRDGVRKISHKTYINILNNISQNISTNYQEEIQDAKYIELQKGPLKKPTKIFNKKGGTYPRNKNIAFNALQNAMFKCEVNHKHETFIAKKTGKSYVEAHHLIPMKFQDDYNVSIDVPENIISLCPNCHRAFHSAQNDLKKKILQFFINKRQILLKERKVFINEQELFEMYNTQ